MGQRINSFFRWKRYRTWPPKKMSAAASSGSRFSGPATVEMPDSASPAFEHPKDGSKSEVDRSAEFEHPKIGHTDPIVNKHGHPVEQQEAVDVLPRQRRQMTVAVGHDAYLMVGIAVFLTFGLGTKYCVRGKEKPT